MQPDPRERAARGARLCELVLVVRKTQVVSTAVDLELRTEVLLRHRGALDVPTRSTLSPRRAPREVLTGLLRLPEREVTLIGLQLARFLGDHLVELRAREPAVVREGADAEVHVAVGDVGHVLRDQLFDERDDFALSSRSRAAPRRADRARGRSVSSRYQSVARAASSRLGIPWLADASYTRSSTSVMFATSLTSWPFSSSHRFSHRPRTNGLALPTWTRAYTVGPQTYMPIWRRSGATSTSDLVSES